MELMVAGLSLQEANTKANQEFAAVGAPLSAEAIRIQRIYDFRMQGYSYPEAAEKTDEIKERERK